MNDDIYLHTIFASRFYNTKKSLKILKKILESNAILSRRGQGLKGSINFCGEDYISLSDYAKRTECKDNEYNGYYQYVRFHPSFIFPKESLDVEIPIILDEKIQDYSNSISLMRELGSNKEHRYSDLPDEVQVKDKIDLDKMSGFVIPSYEMMNFWRNDDFNTKIIKIQIDMYKKILYSYGKEVPFYDSITGNSLEEEENIKETVKSLKIFNKQ